MGFACLASEGCVLSLRLLSPARRSGLWVRLPSKGRDHAQALGLCPGGYSSVFEVEYPFGASSFLNIKNISYRAMHCI